MFSWTSFMRLMGGRKCGLGVVIRNHEGLVMASCAQIAVGFAIFHLAVEAVAYQLFARLMLKVLADLVSSRFSPLSEIG
ncbi:hypothetical protein ACOSP7_029532 [Xanthoceras sorbifolium]